MRGVDASPAPSGYVEELSNGPLTTAFDSQPHAIDTANRHMKRLPCEFRHHPSDNGSQIC
jgi:hypothetical protein